MTRLTGLLEEFRQLAGSAAELLVLATDPDAVAAELAASRAGALCGWWPRPKGAWPASSRPPQREEAAEAAERARDTSSSAPRPPRTPAPGPSRPAKSPSNEAEEAEARREREVGEPRARATQARELAETATRERTEALAARPRPSCRGAHERPGAVTRPDPA